MWYCFSQASQKSTIFSILFCFITFSLESYAQSPQSWKVNNWFLNHFIEIPRRSIITCFLSLLTKAGLNRWFLDFQNLRSAVHDHRLCMYRRRHNKPVENLIFCPLKQISIKSRLGFNDLEHWKLFWSSFSLDGVRKRIISEKVAFVFSAITIVLVRTTQIMIC